MKPNKSLQECINCGGRFTPSGLKRHRNSKKCRIQTAERPLRETAKINAAAAKARGKSRTYYQVGRAIEARSLSELTGLEHIETSFVATDGIIDPYLSKEYWVYNWLHTIWQHYRKQNVTRNFYPFLVELSNMDDVTRQKHIGLKLLVTQRLL